MPDIYTSGFENETNPISEFYFRFRFWPRIVSCMWFCIGLPNFIQIGLPVDELWRHVDFPEWRPPCLKCTSGFRFGDVSHLWRSKTIRLSNFAKITQSTAEILLHPVSENEWSPYWNSTSGFHFVVFVVTQNAILHWCTRISPKSDHQRWSYDGMAIFKMAAVSYVGFAFHWPPTKCDWRSELSSQISAWSGL